MNPMVVLDVVRFELRRSLTPGRTRNLVCVGGFSRRVDDCASNHDPGQST